MGSAIELRRAMLVERKIGGFKRKVVECRRSAGGRQYQVDNDLPIRPTQPGAAVRRRRCFDFDAEPQGDFFAERTDGGGVGRRVLEPADAVAFVQNGDVYTEPCKGLRQFQTQRPGA